MRSAAPVVQVPARLSLAESGQSETNDVGAVNSWGEVPAQESVEGKQQFVHDPSPSEENGQKRIASSRILSVDSALDKA